MKGVDGREPCPWRGFRSGDALFEELARWMFRRGAFGRVTVVRGSGKDRLTRRNARSGLDYNWR